MKFSTPAAAYLWAQEILIPWRSGRAFDCDPEQFRGGTGAMGAVIAAIAIDTRAERACCGAKRCPRYDPKCFLNWWLPEPCLTQIQLSDSEVGRIENCIAEFDRLLREAGVIE